MPVMAEQSCSHCLSRMNAELWDLSDGSVTCTGCKKEFGIGIN